MGEFIRVASQMTPEVQQMIFEGVKILAPKAAQPNLMSNKKQSVNMKCV